MHRFVYILQHQKIKVNKILFNFQLSFVGTILQPYKFIFVQLDACGQELQNVLVLFFLVVNIFFSSHIIANVTIMATNAY